MVSAEGWWFDWRTGTSGVECCKLVTPAPFLSLKQGRKDNIEDNKRFFWIEVSNIKVKNVQSLSRNGEKSTVSCEKINSSHWHDVIDICYIFWDEQTTVLFGLQMSISGSARGEAYLFRLLKWIAKINVNEPFQVWNENNCVNNWSANWPYLLVKIIEMEQI